MVWFMFDKKRDNELNEKMDELNNEINSLKLSYEKLLNDYSSLKSENTNLKMDFSKFKNESTEIFDSHHQLFSLLFLDYHLVSKGLLKYIQELSLELLNFITNVCQKYDLEYWIDFGTLLGAVRHQNYIPWDDDIDLGMLRKDSSKFFEIINDELNLWGLENTITVKRDVLTVDGYNVGFIQIFYNPNNLGILSSVDIFSYDFIKYFDENTEELFYKEQQLFHGKIKRGIDRRDVEMEYYDKLNLSDDPQEFIIPGIDGFRTRFIYGFDLLKTENIFPLKKIKFNNGMYNSPNNTDYYLKSIYGEYNKIPFKIRHHNTVNRLRGKTKIDEILKYNISFLREVNENFSMENINK